MLALAGTVFTAVFAYKSASRVKTSNGASSGELIEKMAEDLSLLKLWIIEHMRDHESSARGA